MQNQSLRRALFAAASVAAIATAAPDTAVHAAAPARHTSGEAVFISHMINPPGPAAQLTPPAPNC